DGEIDNRNRRHQKFRTLIRMATHRRQGNWRRRLKHKRPDRRGTVERILAKKPRQLASSRDAEVSITEVSSVCICKEKRYGRCHRVRISDSESGIDAATYLRVNAAGLHRRYGRD